MEVLEIENKVSQPDILQAGYRLCFIVPSLERGGAERNLTLLLNHLDMKKYSIHLLCLSATGAHGALLDSRIQLVDLKHPSVYFSIFRIRREIKKIAPDAVISWMGYLNAYLAFFMGLFPKKIKWICRESSIPSLHNKALKYSFLFSFFYRFYNRYDRIICQSAYMADDLVNNLGVQREKVRIIHNPLPLSKAIEKKTAGKQYDLLYVGRLSAEKRVHLLVEVMTLLPEKYRLTIVGDGPLKMKIAEQVRSLKLDKRINMIPSADDTGIFYKKSDCLLLASAYEGFPNVVIEAFAAGCPAIGFNITGGANEVLENYGGFIVEDSGLQSFAEKISAVCEGEPLDKSLIAQKAEDKFNITKIIDQFGQLFCEVLDTGSSKR